MKLGELIASYRRDRNLTIDEVAKESGISRLVLWRIERGQYENCKHVPSLIRWLFSK
jgi:transcriptional regulator with XRE-family HTH domain